MFKLVGPDFCFQMGGDSPHNVHNVIIKSTYVLLQRGESCILVVLDLPHVRTFY